MRRSPPRKIDYSHPAWTSTKLHPIDHLLPGVIAAVREAGETVRAEFHRLHNRDGRARARFPANFEWDLEVVLRDRLDALWPRDFHGEELRLRPREYPDCWVVDPLDGTRAFVRGVPGSAISVALIRQNSPVLAVVYAPCARGEAGDLFAWMEG